MKAYYVALILSFVAIVTVVSELYYLGVMPTVLDAYEYESELFLDEEDYYDYAYGEYVHYLDTLSPDGDFDGMDMARNALAFEDFCTCDDD